MMKHRTLWYSPSDCEVEHSWARSQRYGLNRHLEPKKVMNNLELKKHLEFYETFIAAFLKAIKKISTYIYDKYLFFLTDPNGLLLSLCTTDKDKNELSSKL